EGLVACLFPQEFTGEFGHGSKSTRVLWSQGTKCRILFDTGPTVAGQPDPGAPTEAVGSAHDLARITSVGRSVQLVGAAVGHQGLTGHVLGVAPPIPAAPPRDDHDPVLKLQDHVLPARPCRHRLPLSAARSV